MFFLGGILLEPQGLGVIPSLKPWANNNEKKHPVCLLEVVGFKVLIVVFPTSYCRSTKTNDHHPTKTSGIHLVFGRDIDDICGPL